MHNADLRSWLYKPISTIQDIQAWAQRSVITLPETMEPDDMLITCNQRRVPYVLEDGSKQFVRCFLVQTPGTQNTFSIFLHGPHAIMDGRPTLLAFSLLLSFMSESTVPLAGLDWGTEWKNLPAGPVTATGGPRPNWETEAVPLLEKIREIYANPIASYPYDRKFGCTGGR